MKMEMQRRIGKNLRTVRTSKKLTQGEVANFLGVTRTLYTHYELGNRAQDAESLYNLSGLYGIEMSAFFELDHNKLLNIIVNGIKTTDDSKELLNIFDGLTPFSQGKLIERAIVLSEQDEERREKCHAIQAAPFR